MASNQQTVANALRQQVQGTPSPVPVQSDESPDKQRAISAEEFERVDKNRREVQKLLDAANKELTSLKAANAGLEKEVSAAQKRLSSLEAQADEVYTDESLKEAAKKFRKERADYEKERADYLREKEEFSSIAQEAAEKDRRTLAESLSKSSGIDVDTLLEKGPTPESMKAFAWDNRKEGVAPAQPGPTPPLPTDTRGYVPSEKSPEQKIMSGMSRLLK